MKAFSRSGRFKVIVTMPLSSATLMSSSDITLECGGKRSATPLWIIYRVSRAAQSKAPSPLRSAGALHILLSFEYRLAFVDVRVQAFFRIFGLEQLLLQLAFERQRGFEWNLSAGLHGAFYSPDRARGFVRRRELPRISHHLLHEILNGF